MARERYLLDAEETSPIHDNVVQMTTKKQKIENWWFYNSSKLIACILIAVLVFAIAFTVLTKESPDYYVGMLVNRNFDSSLTDILEDQLAVYGEDLNGDGKVIVEIVNCSIGNGSEVGSDTSTSTEVAATKLLADLNNGNSIIWICDDAGYLYSDNDSYTIFADMFDSENPAIKPLDDFEALANLDFSEYENDYLDTDEVTEIFSSFYVAFRDEIGTATGTTAKEEYYENCEELLDNFLTGTVVSG
ncbi:MAG: hypothetical protein R3Y33_00460 [Clostridia bacterium]